MRGSALGLLGCLFLSGSVLIGCGRKSEPGQATPTGASKDTKFTLNGPALATSIQQGESQTIKLTLARGKDFAQNLKLDVKDEPKGIDAKLNATTLKPAEDGEVKLTVVVGPKAAVGQHEVVVQATPENGTATTLKVPIKVQAAAANEAPVSLSAPLLAPSIKQGDTQTIDLTVKRAKEADQNVKLKVDGIPEGIKATVDPITINNADSKSVKLTIGVAKTAPLGEHTLTIHATPATGSSSALKVSFKVKEP